jgi:1-acyl-sn-glycerol-3-phosphate acyltransferase
MGAVPTERASEQPYQDPLRPFTVWDTLRSVLLWTIGLPHLIFWLIVFVLLDLTVMSGKRFDRLVRFVNRCVTALLGIRVEQRGREELPRRSTIFCINHVSILDAPVVVQSIPFYSRSFQDRAHFRIPGYGWFMRIVGQLPVDRADKELTARSFERALEMLRRGDSFCVFPEGHRTRDGRLGRFFPGAFRLALSARVPIVPVAVRGLRNLCPAGEWRIRPGRVQVFFGRPIPVEGSETEEELAGKTFAAMSSLLWTGLGQTAGEQHQPGRADQPQPDQDQRLLHEQPDGVAEQREQDQREPDQRVPPK